MRRPIACKFQSNTFKIIPGGSLKRQVCEDINRYLLLNRTSIFYRGYQSCLLLSGCPPVGFDINKRLAKVLIYSHLDNLYTTICCGIALALCCAADVVPSRSQFVHELVEYPFLRVVALASSCVVLISCCCCVQQLSIDTSIIDWSFSIISQATRWRTGQSIPVCRHPVALRLQYDDIDYRLAYCLMSKVCSIVSVKCYRYPCVPQIADCNSSFQETPNLSIDSATVKFNLQ